MTSRDTIKYGRGILVRMRNFGRRNMINKWFLNIFNVIVYQNLEDAEVFVVKHENSNSSFIVSLKQSEKGKSNHYKSIIFFMCFPCSSYQYYCSPVNNICMDQQHQYNKLNRASAGFLHLSLFSVSSQPIQNKYNTTAHLVQNYQFPLHLPAQDGPKTKLHCASR